MSLDQYALLAEIVGAVAIVVTLVYLAIQLRQNTVGIRANAYQTWLSAAIAEQAVGQNPAMAETIATGLFDPTSLTEGNWVPFANYCHTFILKTESTYFLQKERIIKVALDDLATFRYTGSPRERAFTHMRGPSMTRIDRP